MIQEGFSIYISGGKVFSESFFRKGNDSFTLEDEDLLIFLEGIILNKKKLLAQNQKTDFSQLFRDLYTLKKADCVKDLEGEFRGVIYDKKIGEVLAFTNPCATQSVYFTQNSDGFFIDSSLVRLNRTLQNKGIRTKPNLNAVYQILVCVNILEDKTVVENVFRLLDGEFLTFNMNGDKLRREFYFTVNTDSYFSGSKDEALDLAHQIFSEAVLTEYQKDTELGKMHLALLSGGLDSRVAMFYAMKIKQKPDTAFCFSQSGYLDETISRNIAADYDLPYIFVPLDGGSYLKYIDEVTEISEGSGHFTGGIHVKFATEKLNNQSFGIFHSGQIGDGILGGFNSAPTRKKPSHFKIVNNPELLPKIESELNGIISKYDTEELFLLRNVAYNRTVLGAKVFQQTAFHTSPFMVKDFLTFSLSLPERWKFNHHFYLEWISKHLKEATAYPWERTMMKPDAHWKTSFGDRIKKRTFIKWNEKVVRKPYRSSMYPYQYYFSQSEEIQQYYKDYFELNIHRLEDYPELKKDVELLFSKSDFQSKSLAVNVLSVFKLFFG